VRSRHRRGHQSLRDGWRTSISFAVIRALALRHGYVRHTEDIDILTTPEGLGRIT
jgi:hypothetical protein